RRTTTTRSSTATTTSTSPRSSSSGARALTVPHRRALRSRYGAVVHTAFTDTGDGDLNVRGEAAALRLRRDAVAAGPWTWLDQVHGAEVVVVGAPGEHAGRPADAAVTAAPGAVLAVHTADCGGVLLWDTDGHSGP